MPLATSSSLRLLAAGAAGALLGGIATFARLTHRAPSAADRWSAFRAEQLSKGGQLVDLVWQETPRTFVLRDCSIALAEMSSDGRIETTRVLKTGFYLVPTACTSQSLHAEETYLVAELHNRAFGAGGGNTTGGTYRSRDGRTWEKRVATGWKSVDEAQ